MKYILLLVVIMLMGCTRKTGMIHQQDSAIIVKKEVQTILEPRNMELVFMPCDTNGILRSFNFKDSTGSQVIQVYTIKDRIHVKIQRDTIKQIEKVIDSLIIQRKAEKVIEERTKTPRWAKYSFALNVLLLAIIYVGISTKI